MSNLPMRPFEEEYGKALDALNGALKATALAKTMEQIKREEFHLVSKKFYDANPDLPRPESRA